MSAGMELLGFSETVQDFRRMKEWAGDDDVVYVVGTDVEYAAFVEFGTSKMKAQPYLRPAARQVARSPGTHIGGDPDSVNQFVRQLALAIERQAKKKAPVDTGNLKASIRAERIR